MVMKVTNIYKHEKQILVLNITRKTNAYDKVLKSDKKKYFEKED